MFGVLYGAPESADAALADVAREFSPRIDVCGAREIAIDLHGVARLFGDAREIAQELRRTAADRGLRVRVAIAGTRTAARLLVRYRAGLTIVEPGTEAAVLAPLPIALLEALGNPKSQSPNPKSQTAHLQLQTPPTETLRQWGLRTLGEFAALASDDVAARLGQAGVWWQRIARGEDPAPLVPALPEERFEQALDLEWPIEGLEPLSFVLGRLMEPLSTHLERRDRGAAVLHVRLHLVTRTTHERTLQLPVAMRDPRTLRALALLDLESNPPSAAIDRVVVAVDPTPGRIVQYSLLTRPLPSPEQISTLMARLTALMGEGRCGAPAVVDSWQPGVFAMQPFVPREVGDRDSFNDTGRRRGGEVNSWSGLHASAGAGGVRGDSHSSHDTARRGGGEINLSSGLHASAGAGVVRGDSYSSHDTARRGGGDDGTQSGVIATSASGQSDLPASSPRHVVDLVNVAAIHPVRSSTDGRLVTALRRFRFPVPARVRMEDGKPVRVVTDRRGLHGGRVDVCAGPWRTSGAWWEDDGGRSRQSPGAGALVRRSVGDSGRVRRSLGEGGWDCDEWDVTLADGATYRLSRARDVDQWFIDGIVD